MSSPELAAPASSPSEAEDIAGLRNDFMSAIGWMALGIAILIGSVTMDRLENKASTLHHPRTAFRACSASP